MTTAQPPRPNARELEQGTDVDTETVLAALDDEACRCILSATDDECKTVQELSDACDIPRSTVYRKVDLLVEATLLDERVRLDANGRHSKEYTRSVSGVELTVGDESIDVALARDGEDRRPLRA